MCYWKCHVLYIILVAAIQFYLVIWPTMYIKDWPLLMLLMTYKSTVYTPDKLLEVYQETMEKWELKKKIIILNWI